MPATSLAVKEQRKLSALNSDLPVLAAQAAIELDNLLQGISSDLEATTKLGDLLENSLREDQSSGQHRPFMDAATSTVLNQALARTRGGTKAQTLEQLVTQAQQLASGLYGRSIQEPENAHMIEKLRTFCASLSLASSSCIQSFRSSRPAHPFKR